MTILRPKSARASSAVSPRERDAIRGLLRKASRGNVHAFIQAASRYVELVNQYVHLCGVSYAEERLRQTEMILLSCWRCLPYTRRVSDFERFLQIQLERFSERNPPTPLPSPHENIALLDHRHRFLLAARVFHGWSFKELRLSLRCGKRELSIALMQLKAVLAGTRLESLVPSELLQVLRVSDLLEGALGAKAARKVESELARQYHAHEFKANWLAYRCELAELRSDIAFSPEDAESLRERITQELKQLPMNQPRLSDSLINQFTFVRLPGA